MSALQYNLRMQQGATFKKVIRWLDAQGNPKPIADWRGRMQIKSAYGGSGALLSTLTTETGEIILAPGYITLQLTALRTRNDLPVAFKSTGPGTQTYFYDLFLTDTNSQARRFMYGNVFVTGALTDAL